MCTMMYDDTPSPHGSFTGRVAAIRYPCRAHFEVTLAFDTFPDCAPGQFLQILCRTPDSNADNLTLPHAGPMLRRPFSIGGLRRADRCEIDIMGRVVGLGTAWLNARRVDDEINVIGPLGRGFSQPSATQTALLVAGGVGLPPVRWLAQTLAARGAAARFIFGAQSRDLIPLTLNDRVATDGEFTACVGEFSAFDLPSAITTDDGSCGLPGRVTDVMRVALMGDRHAEWTVYACGPEPMLHAVGRLCDEMGVPCQLALERVMACGLATCQSCVVKVADGNADDGWRYALCCTEGPVFDSKRLIWDAP